MTRCDVRHLCVKDSEGFDLRPGERVFNVIWEHPYFHLVLLWEEPEEEPGG